MLSADPNLDQIRGVAWLRYEEYSDYNVAQITVRIPIRCDDPE